MEAYSAKDYDAALHFFEQALESETRYSDEILYGFMSNVYAKQENWQAAADAQEKVLATKPDYRGLVSLGMLRHYAGDDRRAEEAYNAAIAQDAKSAEAYASLAALYLGQNRASEAVPLLEKATTLSPKIALFHANLAVAYAMTGAKEQSHASLAQAEALKCDNLAAFKERVQEELEKSATEN
jgi:tetratricopeptide (TPR) repeat protein